MSARLPEPLTVAEYARQVRAALGDLPYEDVLEDLDEHLAELAAEDPTPLEVRLGTPAAYADELRRAAGLTPPVPERVPPLADRIDAAVLRVVDREETQAVLAFLPELRPAWWVLRAWLAVGALSHLAGLGSWLLPFGPLLGLPVVAAAVVLSVRLGRRTRSRPPVEPRERLLALGGNTVLGLLALVAFATVQQQPSPVYASSSPYGPGDGRGSTLVGPDGRPVTNIFPYSSTGQPLTSVLLYDQDGRALANVATTAPDGTTVERVVPPGSPPPPAHAYPQQQRRTTYDGQVVDAPAPWVPDGLATPTPTAPPTPAPPTTAVPTPAVPTPAVPTPAAPTDTATPAAPTPAPPTPAPAPS